MNLWYYKGHRCSHWKKTKERRYNVIVKHKKFPAYRVSFSISSLPSSSSAEQTSPVKRLWNKRKRVNDKAYFTKFLTGVLLYLIVLSGCLDVLLFLLSPKCPGVHTSWSLLPVIVKLYQLTLQHHKHTTLQRHRTSFQLTIFLFGKYSNFILEKCLPHCLTPWANNVWKEKKNTL